MAGRKPRLGNKLISELLKKYPNTSTKGIARLAMRDNPLLFSSEGAARSTVRYLRGELWKVNSMKSLRYKKFGSPIRIPEGEERIKGGWNPLYVNNPGRTLIIGDLHIPYHRRVPIEMALREAHGVKTIILNGDIIDCHAASQWADDPRTRNFKKELEATRTVLRIIRKNFPRTRIIYKHGNHEERWEKYMWVHAPYCLDVEEFHLNELLKFRELNIEEVKDKRPIIIGDLAVIHGHEYKFSIQNPISPARGLFLRAIEHAICNHFHQITSHSEKSITDKLLRTWSIGCMCDLHPPYMPMNKWAWGFALVDVNKDGSFTVHNKTIRGGKIY